VLVCLQELRDAGQSVFNEAAFNRREAIFSSVFEVEVEVEVVHDDMPTPAAAQGGSERGRGRGRRSKRVPYSSVCKTFQVSVWRRVLACWRGLSLSEQTELCDWSGIDLKAAMSELPSSNTPFSVRSKGKDKEAKARL
jgi:hypothetical protein